MSRAMTAWIVVVAAGVGTYALRASFMVMAHRAEDLPPFLRELLRMIPAAALAALAGPALLRGGEQHQLALWSPRFLAGFVALMVAWKFRSLFATILVGLVAIVALETFLTT